MLFQFYAAPFLCIPLKMSDLFGSQTERDAHDEDDTTVGELESGLSMFGFPNETTSHAPSEKFDMNPEDAKDPVEKTRFLMVVVAKRLKALSFMTSLVDLLAFVLLACFSLLPEASHYWICAVGTEALLRLTPLFVLLGLTVTHCYLLYSQFNKRKAMHTLFRDLSIGAAGRVIICVLVAMIKIKMETVPTVDNCDTRIGVATVWAIAAVLASAGTIYATVWHRSVLLKDLTRTGWAWQQPRKWDKEQMDAFAGTPNLII